MREVVLIYKKYDALYDAITPLNYFDDIHSHGDFYNNIYYVNLGFLDDDELETVNSAIIDSGIILKTIQYTLECGTPFDDFLTSIL